MEVLLATIKGANGKPRVSAYVLQKALLEFFTQFKLFPMGVYADIPAVQSWALKYAVAIKKLVTFLHHFKSQLLLKDVTPKLLLLSYAWVLSLARFCLCEVSRFRRLLRRAPSSKYNKLSEIKQKAKDCGWCSKCDEEDDDDSDEEDIDTFKELCFYFQEKLHEIGVGFECFGFGDACWKPQTLILACPGPEVHAQVQGCPDRHRRVEWSQHMLT